MDLKTYRTHQSNVIYSLWVDTGLINLKKNLGGQRGRFEYRLAIRGIKKLSSILLGLMKAEHQRINAFSCFF